ncbi:RNA 2'-phosphotransferase [Bradyrhizobium cajani]|nr:RNA 2'-phosphotransferase [Bradyrhizobium cajani]MCP3370723.1 RNA 2'-phosphotransferase [Bradyrhizobium cajani]
MPVDQIQLSKFLSFVLRHKPDEIGLTLGPEGWVNIFKVDAGGMHAKGLKFYRADNGVWLTDHVPPEFLT